MAGENVIVGLLHKLGFDPDELKRIIKAICDAVVAFDKRLTASEKTIAELRDNIARLNELLYNMEQRGYTLSSKYEEVIRSLPNGNDRSSNNGSPAGGNGSDDSASGS